MPSLFFGLAASFDKVISRNHVEFSLFHVGQKPALWPDVYSFERELRDGLRRREWKLAAARRRDMSEIAGGINRGVTSALHVDKNRLTEYQRARLRAIVCGGVHTLQQDGSGCVSQRDRQLVYVPIVTLRRGKVFSIVGGSATSGNPCAKTPSKDFLENRVTCLLVLQNAAFFLRTCSFSSGRRVYKIKTYNS